MAKYRLTARAQMDGEVREPGYLFELKDGERGPHRTQVSDHGSAGALRDVPLYVPAEEPKEELKEVVAEQPAEEMKKEPKETPEADYPQDAA